MQSPRVGDNALEALVAALASGDQRACARLISRMERGESGLVPLLQALYRAGGRGRVIGITGPPGAGKSTLIGRLIGAWRKRGLSVAVLAVDPSSPISGGALLGDRLRMIGQGPDDKVFIRSMASRGHLGGLAKVAGDALTVLDAMPWDRILVETVGVGQNETDIMLHAQVIVLLQTPMGGDDIQAVKAGINEISDIFVVNKSDHPDADRTVRQLRDMIELRGRLGLFRDWQPPVLKTQAQSGEGIDALVDGIERCFLHFSGASDPAGRRERRRLQLRVGEILRQLIDERFRGISGASWDDLLDAVRDRTSDPYALAHSLLARLQ